MIKRRKKQSYNPQYLLAFATVIPLIGFFAYAYYVPRFSLYLTFSLFVVICILLYFRNTLAQKVAMNSLEKQEYIERTNLLKVEMEKAYRAIEADRKKIVDYSQLKDLTEKLSMVFSPEEASRTLSSNVNKFFGHKDITTILYLFHSKIGDLGISASQKGQIGINLKDKKGDIYDQWVVKTMKPLRIEDIKKDFRFDEEKIVHEEQRSIRSLMSVPLTVDNKALGILRVDSSKENQFSTEDFRLLTTIGDLGAIAIENAQLYERIEDLAIRDSLTNLFLRRKLLDSFSQEISRASRRKNSLSFMMIDLDEFKKYNDKFGHTAGDIVLKTIGRILLEKFAAPGNMVCRYGGEEFAVLLPDCPKDKAMELAEAFRKNVEKEEIILRREKTRITVSAGVASFPKDARIKDDLIQKADEALYQAKAKGRNKVIGA